MYLAQVQLARLGSRCAQADFPVTIQYTRRTAMLRICSLGACCDCYNQT